MRPPHSPVRSGGHPKLQLYAIMPLLLVVATIALFLPSPSAQEFVHWEVPHVSPLALTPSGDQLLAVNTADHHLEIFDSSGEELARSTSVAVGMAPVSVRLRTETEAWVVNHISDSISIVALDGAAGPRVVRTLRTDDEPADVVFAGNPTRAFVSCSQANTVLIFDLDDLDAAPRRLRLQGEDPRALAVSPDGNRVYVAIFESGNATSIVGGPGLGPGGFTGPKNGVEYPPNFVADAAGPYAGQSPPPNDGANFSPPLNPANPPAPEAAQIIRKNEAGLWLDGNGADWTRWVSGNAAAATGRPVGWDLPDRDLAVIRTVDESVSYVSRLMNICMAMTVNPANGRIMMVGTDATNEIRFEPNLNGTFVRVTGAVIAGNLQQKSIVDLNTHLDYTAATLPQPQRDLSIGDPRGVVMSPSGARAYVTGMGSDNVVVLDAQARRVGAPPIEVASGPTGITLNADGSRAYVLGRFESAISVIDIAQLDEVQRLPFFDATPEAIKLGRPFLYDTHRTSGLGQASCGSCHVDARLDRLAWDLGNPAGEMKSPIGQNLAGSLIDPGQDFSDFHPLKGPMTTQTLQDIIGKEPFHWSGDKDGLEGFNGAFTDLQGDDMPLTPEEMQLYEDFLATISFPPNPFRGIDNSLPNSLSLHGHYTTGAFSPAGQPLPNGDAVRGLELYRPPNLTTGSLACVSCHSLPTGMGTGMIFENGMFEDIPEGPLGESHHLLVSKGADGATRKVPQLRNLYERVGFDATQVENVAGFGFLHDGSVDSLARFLALPPFDIDNDQDLADLVAFMLAFSGSDLPEGSATDLLEGPGTASLDTHAGVGRQLTVSDPNTLTAAELSELSLMQNLANQGAVGLIVKATRGGVPRGYAYLSAGLMLSDRAQAPSTAAAVFNQSAVGSESTWTLVAKGTELRLGVDRDGDGYYDRDEIDAGSDPANALSVPNICLVTAEDLGSGLAGFGGTMPVFSACGTLATGGTATFQLTNARPSSSAGLVLALEVGNVPFKGGVLVPKPTLTLGPFNTANDGTLSLGPLGVGGGPLDVYTQWIISDPDAPVGFALSNALLLKLLP